MRQYRSTARALALLLALTLAFSLTALPAYAIDDNTFGSTRETVPRGDSMNSNYGMIGVYNDDFTLNEATGNFGTIKTNYAPPVEYDPKNGTVLINQPGGTVSENLGWVYINAAPTNDYPKGGFVDVNKGTIGGYILDSDGMQPATYREIREMELKEGEELVKDEKSDVLAVDPLKGNSGTVSKNAAGGTILINQDKGIVEENIGIIGGYELVWPEPETLDVGEVEGPVAEAIKPVPRLDDNGNPIVDEKTGNFGIVETNAAAGTILVNREGGIIGSNAGLVGVKDGTGKPAQADGTGNYGIISINTGTVTYNASSGGRKDYPGGIIAANAGTVVKNAGAVFKNAGTITENTEDGIVETNLKGGIISANAGMVGGIDESDELIAGTGNLGTITVNTGKVTENTGTVTDNNKGGAIFINRGTVTNNNDGGVLYANYGTVTYNNKGGVLYDNYGTVTNNNKGSKIETNLMDVLINAGVITENTGTVDTNNGSIETNNGTVNTNNGSIETNNGIVRINIGTIKINNGTVIINLRDSESIGSIGTNNGMVGALDENGFILADSGNTGKVETNGAGGIVFNREEGSVTKNEGVVYSFGGSVETNTGTGTFSVDTEAPTITLTLLNENDDGYGQKWLVDTDFSEGTSSYYKKLADVAVDTQATVILTPAQGYEITNGEAVKNIKAIKDGETGEWSLIITADIDDAAFDSPVPIVTAAGADGSKAFSSNNITGGNAYGSKNSPYKIIDEGNFKTGSSDSPATYEIFDLSNLLVTAITDSPNKICETNMVKALSTVKGTQDKGIAPTADGTGLIYDVGIKNITEVLLLALTKQIKNGDIGRKFDDTYDFSGATVVINKASPPHTTGVNLKKGDLVSWIVKESGLKGMTIETSFFMSGNYELSVKFKGDNDYSLISVVDDIKEKPQPEPEPEPEPQPKPQPQPVPQPYSEISSYSGSGNTNSGNGNGGGADYTPPRGTANDNLTVTGTVGNQTVTKNVKDVLEPLPEGDELTKLLNSSHEFFQKSFGIENGKMLDSGIVSFNGDYDNSKEKTIAVPLKNDAYLENHTYTVVFSDGTVLQVTCTEPGVLWIPFPHDADGLAFVVLEGTIETNKDVKNAIINKGREIARKWSFEGKGAETFANNYLKAIADGHSEDFAAVYAQEIAYGRSETYAAAFATKRQEGQSVFYAMAYAGAYAKAIADGNNNIYAGAYAAAIADGKEESYAVNYANAYVAAIDAGFNNIYAGAYATAIADGKKESYALIYAGAYAKAIADGNNNIYAGAYAAAYATKWQEGMDYFYAMNYAGAFAAAIADGKSVKEAVYAGAYAAAFADSNNNIYAGAYADAIADDKEESYARDYAGAYAKAIADSNEESYARDYAGAYAKAIADGSNNIYAGAYAAARADGKSEKEAIYAGAYADAVANKLDLNVFNNAFNEGYEAAIVNNSEEHAAIYAAAYANAMAQGKRKAEAMKLAAQAANSAAGKGAAAGAPQGAAAGADAGKGAAAGAKEADAVAAAEGAAAEAAASGAARGAAEAATPETGAKAANPGAFDTQVAAYDALTELQKKLIEEALN